MLKIVSRSSLKRFNHVPFEFQKLKRVTMHDKRYYELPNGELAQSVTTRLGEVSDKTGLFEWRKRVGKEEAQKISTQAAVRGTAIHTLCEHYLLNEEEFARGAMPTNVSLFRQIQPIIDQNIDNIYGLETSLYSLNLRAAGTTDCLAEWNGVPSVIDFKTSRNLKKEDWITNYFLQATTYAMMGEELMNMEIPQIVILIAVDHEEPQVFVKQNEPYRDRVREIFC